jgi:uncharacterized protein YcbK (DUF882 family)
LAVTLSALAAQALSTPTVADPPVFHASGHASKKGGSFVESPSLLATLVQTHTDERVPLDETAPDPERFDALLADRVTGSSLPLDPRLLALLRSLAARHTGDGGAARIELVSGYRSPKLNEMLRKKGHHVASHSQHSLGHACDFRIIEGGAERGIDPRTLELEIRALGWEGGIGVYTTRDDWFVHADVGPNRRWVG